MLRHKEASSCISEEMSVGGRLGEKALVPFSPIFYQDEKPDEKWILFDGPVDTLWIESMNSVMDDNKVLTLINGERIALPEQVQGALTTTACRSRNWRAQGRAKGKRKGILREEEVHYGRAEE